MENTYFIDPERISEMTRLNTQGEFVTEAGGGVRGCLPAGFVPACALDIGCGPGEWAFSLLQEFPQAAVTGVDVSAVMIEYANAQAAQRASG